MKNHRTPSRRSGQCRGSDITRQTATPIIVKSAIQTGANTSVGGEKDGFARPLYQPASCGLMAIEPERAVAAIERPIARICWNE